jgi:NADH dehydrogenase
MSGAARLPPHRHGEDAPLCDVSSAGRAPGDGRPHVVIVGAGFGGLSAAKALARAPVNVTVIDRRNHHLFQPLLYQVATAGLSPAQIAAPIRTILRHQANATVLLDEVTGIDAGRREIVTHRQHIPYDWLLLATGARHSYFGHDDWEAFAPGLKTLEDATAIRRRILLSFELAEIECDAALQTRLLTFVVIGAGPTGVELAGTIAEIARHGLASDFRNIDPASARVMLVEAGPRVLPAFPQSLSDDARRRLERLGVEVLTGAAVTGCDADGITIGERRIAAHTVLWAAGVQASPAAQWLGIAGDRSGRVPVGADLSIPGHDGMFAIGDTALLAGKDGRPLPGIAPVAKQQGVYVARLIVRRTKGLGEPRPFVYRDYGNLATIGRRAAVVDFGRVRLTGFIAWVLWSVAHIFFLIGFRNRLSVSFDWLWSYLTYERGARLVTGAPEDQPGRPE